MQAYLTLTRRELATYFLTLTGYVIVAAAVFLMGLSFVVLMVKLQQEPTPMPVTEMFYVTQFFWLILMLSAPVITMRLFAQEKFSGTFETLMTTPVTDLQVVMAKFTGAMLFYMIMWLPLIGCLAIVKRYTGDPAAFDPGAVISTYIGIMALGSVFISLGCLASSLTRSQVTAGMLSLVFGASVFLIAFIADQAETAVTWQRKVLSHLNFFDQMHDFTRGILDTRTLVQFVSITFLLLFFTLRVVETRRWR